MDKFQVTLIGNIQDLSRYRGQAIDTRLPIYSLKEIIRLPPLVPSCDIFWSPHYNVPVLPIRANKRLVTIHDVFHLAHAHSLSRKQRLYARLMMQVAVRLSDRIMTVSEFSKSEIHRYTGVSLSHITVIPNGVNHQQFNPHSNPLKEKTIREKYRIPDRFILFVGNVKPHKNLIRLVEAYALVAKQIPHKLVIVGKKEGFITGDTTLHNKIQQNSFLQENTVFTGFVADEDLPAVYRMASLFVFPSRYEGFGLPPLEAMACGCLTLTSSSASMPEICGEATTYFDPEDPEALAAKIKGLLGLPEPRRREIIARGIEKAATYTWEAAAQHHLNVMHQLC